jgi:hypothetical protein
VPAWAPGMLPINIVDTALLPPYTHVAFLFLTRSAGCRQETS